MAKLLDDAVNTVRKQKNRELAADGMYVSSRTKYIWAQNPENMSRERRIEFDLQRDRSLKASRGWAGPLAVGLRRTRMGDEGVEEVDRLGEAQPLRAHE